MRKIGVLTSGGDAPGMNAAIMSVAKSASRLGMPLVGVKRGYNGLLRKSTSIREDLQELQLDTILDIADQPGTYLRTARCDEFRDPAWREVAVKTLRDMEIDGLVIIGGDGSFQGAMRLCELGIPCVCIPGTIDNDLAYTEMTLGYETAAQVCTDAIRSIRATSRAHDRPHVVECMGRHCGDLALKAACATGSEIVIVPEVPWTVQEVADRLNKQVAKGNTRATIVIAEGCWESMAEPFDMYGFLTSHGKQCFEGERWSAHRLANVLQFLCNIEVRATVVGYTQRGSYPVVRDSAFAFEAGNVAVRLLAEGQSNRVIGMRQGQVFHMPIEEALKAQRPFRQDLYELVNDINQR